MMVKKAKKAEEVLPFASMWNMDGVVMIGFCAQDYVYLRNHMRIPFVVYDGFCEKPERFVNITIDNFDGGRQIGRLFREQGHQKVLCIADNAVGVDQERIQGFRDGFSEETPVLVVPMHKAERWAFYAQQRKHLCEATAIFAVSDSYAMDLIRFLTENGVRVPEEISVAGFDDTPLCERMVPSLTTIRQDGALRARLAVEKLEALKEGACVEYTYRLPVTLVERESTRSR